MFGTEAQTELDDLKVVATKAGGRMKYIDQALLAQSGCFRMSAVPPLLEAKRPSR